MFDLTSETTPARTNLAGQDTVVLVEDEVLKITSSLLTDPILRVKVPKGKVWKLTLSIYGAEEDAP
jgi:hypothetical protein